MSIKRFKDQMEALRATEKFAIQNNRKGYFKGLPAIRVLLFAVPVLSLLFASILLFVGGYQQQNNIIMNGTIQTQYTNFNNSVNPRGGLFGNLTSISSQASTTSNSFGSGINPFDIVTIISVAVKFVQFGINFYLALIGIIVSPLGLIGLPASFVGVIGTILVILIPVLIIISAILLKDI